MPTNWGIKLGFPHVGGGGGEGGWCHRKYGTTQQTVAMPGRKARWHPRDTVAMLDEIWVIIKNVSSQRRDRLLFLPS